MNQKEPNRRIVFKAKPPAASSLAVGFTLLELLVILGVLALLLSVLIPAMSRSGLTSRGFQCLNNNRQLCNAWRMYADDSRDVMVYSSDDGMGTSNPLNPYAWTWSHMDFNPTNPVNWDTNADITVRPLWPFTGRNASIYRCPSDPTYVVVSGVAIPRVRGMSMNFFLGGFAGTDGGYALNSYRLFLKTTDLTMPGPSRTFVFTDERPDFINWGNYQTDMNGYPSQPAQYEFAQDVPGMYHNGGGSFSFADGSAEIHRWLDLRTTPPFRYNYLDVVTIPVPRDPDVAWLQSHSTSLK